MEIAFFGAGLFCFSVYTWGVVQSIITSVISQLPRTSHWLVDVILIFLLNFYPNVCVCVPEEQHIALYDEILVLSQKIRAMLFQAWTEILLTLFSLNIFFLYQGDILFFALKVNTDRLQSGQHNSLSRSQRLNTPHEDEPSDTFELFKNVRVQELYTNSVRSYANESYGEGIYSRGDHETDSNCALPVQQHGMLTV